MANKIGIIGDGNVGSALARGLERAGHEVRAVGRDQEAIWAASSWAEIVLLAVPRLAQAFPRYGGSGVSMSVRPVPGDDVEFIPLPE
jgi:nucleoside-diphosphate-sugar epimerase